MTLFVLILIIAGIPAVVLAFLAWYYLRPSKGQHGNPAGAAFTVDTARHEKAASSTDQTEGATRKRSALRASTLHSPRPVEVFVADDQPLLLVRPYVQHNEVQREALARALRVESERAEGRRGVVEPMAA
ncbi:hypothetical protein AB0K14_03135 [Actinosynnema sp. NPDC050801]|uniref:hypothetical protein n=1 Tax=unclassified Actinosynnema TaxID=2637065 RepID=UPI0033DC5602